MLGPPESICGTSETQFLYLTGARLFPRGIKLLTNVSSPPSPHSAASMNCAPSQVHTKVVNQTNQTEGLEDTHALFIRGYYRKLYIDREPYILGEIIIRFMGL